MNKQGGEEVKDPSWVVDLISGLAEILAWFFLAYFALSVIVGVVGFMDASLSQGCEIQQNKRFYKIFPSYRYSCRIQRFLFEEVEGNE